MIDTLIPDLSPYSSDWKPFVIDEETKSYSFYLQASSPSSGFAFEASELDRWFQELHPSNYQDDGSAWTCASYKGERLLRQTAWTVFDKECSCEYGYSDTWQPILKSKKLQAVIEEITNAMISVVSPSALGPVFNSCNLNYYPQGGGVGFHADDEFLFDGLERPMTIVSLSLTNSNEGDMTTANSNNKGARRFQVREKKVGEDGNDSDPRNNKLKDIKEITLGHGDLMTMEGNFQQHYLHSVWPGDSTAYQYHPNTQGERINLTWRTIAKHLDGSKECKGKICPLSKSTSYEELGLT